MGARAQNVAPFYVLQSAFAVKKYAPQPYVQVRLATIDSFKIG